MKNQQTNYQNPAALKQEVFCWMYAHTSRYSSFIWYEKRKETALFDHDVIPWNNSIIPHGPSIPRSHVWSGSIFKIQLVMNF